jgi:hypothetical protein
MTAMEIAKSKVPGWWGRDRMSATQTECGWCCLAMETKLAERSEPMMKIPGFGTARYLPLPQPMSRPIEPGGRVLRKRSIMGHG